MSFAPEIEKLTPVTAEKDVEIALSVIVPVYDQAETIVENVRTIRERVAAGLPEGEASR